MKNLLLIILSLSIFGCATVDEKIILKYEPSPNIYERRSGVINISKALQSQKQSNNGDWLVGSLNNANGVKRASLFANRSNVDFIVDAIMVELKQIGYTPKIKQKPTGNAIFISDISSFFNVNKGLVTYDLEHKITFNVDLYRNGQKVKSFLVFYQDSETVPPVKVSSQEEKMLTKSAQKAVTQIIKELGNVVKWT